MKRWVTIAALLSGCSALGWYNVTPDTWRTPDLRRVYFMDATLPAPELEPRGPVEVEFRQDLGDRSGETACREVVERTMLELLTRARELGANAVYEVESRGSRHWLKRPVCQVKSMRVKGSKQSREVAVARLRGLAIYDPR